MLLPYSRCMKPCGPPVLRTVVKALGADTGISKSEVSRICADLDEELGAFRDRSLAGIAYPWRTGRKDLVVPTRWNDSTESNVEPTLVGVFPNPPPYSDSPAPCSSMVHDEWQVAAEAKPELMTHDQITDPHGVE